MKLLFEENDKQLLFSLNAEEKLTVELIEDGIRLDINLDNQQMAKLIDGLKLIIYESDL